METLTCQVGMVSDRYTVRTVTGKGSGLTFRFDVSGSASDDAPILLEIQEIHNRRPQTFGYSVIVGGEPVYFRTYYEEAAGPNHYFVAVPRRLVGDPAKLTVRLENQGEAPFSLARIWAYADFFGLAQAEAVDMPLTVLAPVSDTANGEHAELRFGYFSAFDAEGGYVYNEDHRAHNRLLETAVARRVPLQIALSAWFCGSPGGPDGQGGMFSDPKYSQLHYLNGALHPHFPNTWGNAFGYPSMTEPRINQYLDAWREATVRHIRTRLDFFKARGQAIELNLCSDIGSTYFTPDYDFSEFEVAAAARDGITLDPANMGMQERLWQHRNIARYHERIANAFQRGAGRDSVWVDRGRLVLPTRQLADNLYSHPHFRTMEPSGHRQYRGWQTGVAEGMWVSGELGTETRAAYDYVAALGKVAIVNVYSANTVPRQVDIEQMYQLGWQLAALYDPASNVFEEMAKWEGIGDGPALPPVHYERELFDYNFWDTRRLGEVLSENSKLGVGGGAYGVIAADPAEPVSVLCRLADPGLEPEANLAVYIHAAGIGSGVEIAAGNDPGQLTTVGRIESNQLRQVAYWTDRPGAVGRLDLPRNADGQVPAWLKLTWRSGAVSRIRVGASWPQLTGHTAGLLPERQMERTDQLDPVRIADDNWLWVADHPDSSPWTRREFRIQHLWIQQRAVTGQILRRYRAIGGEDDVYRQALALYDQSRYTSAYRLLVGEISQLLPARYAIRGHGPLGRYPIQVNMPDPDDTLVVTLTKVTPETVEFSLEAETEQPVTLIFDKLTAGTEYHLEKLDVNLYRLSAGPGEPELQRVPVTNAQARLSLTAHPQAQLPVPRRFSALCAGRHHLTNIVEFWHDDPAVLGGSRQRAMSIVGADIQKREIHEADWRREPPELGDFCEVETDEQGKIIAVKSLYGVESGVIAAFEPPTYSAAGHAGIITLDSGNRYEMCWGAYNFNQIDTAQLQANTPRQYNVPMLAAGLKPGQHVRIHYSPYQYGTRPHRIVSITQPYAILLKESFTEPEAWRDKAREVVNIMRCQSWRGPIVQLQDHTRPGYLIYQITSDRLLNNTAVHLQGRTIIRETNKIEIFTGTDLQTWRKHGELTNLDQTDHEHLAFDISEGTAGQKKVYLKIQIHGAGDWSVLWDIEVRTELKHNQEN